MLFRSGALLLFTGSRTGSTAGTTGIPEVPARPAVLPLLRDRRPCSSTVEVKMERGPEVPAPLAVLPALREESSLQRPDFVKGYKCPFTYLGRASFSNSLSSINARKAQSLISQDLPIPPPKFVDLWRIEGEGPDLHLHRAVFHFPLSLLRDLVSRVSFVVTLDSRAHLFLL